MRITDAAALVTGGASGLGLATAIVLRAAGAHVVIVDLPTSPGAEVAAEHDLTFAAADVTDHAHVQAALDTADALGDLRIVVNCAGIATSERVVGRDGPQPLDHFSRVLAVNVAGTFNVVRLAAARMIEAKPLGEERGVIVMTASAAAFDGQIGQAAYSASKGAIAAMTLPIAREFAQHLIRVMTIAPGIFETPMMTGLPDAAQDSLAHQVLHPSRLGKPTEFAALVEHIIENPMLNGETIRLDGALRMAAK